MERRPWKVSWPSLDKSHGRSVLDEVCAPPDGTPYETYVDNMRARLTQMDGPTAIQISYERMYHLMEP